MSSALHVTRNSTVTEVAKRTKASGDCFIRTMKALLCFETSLRTKGHNETWQKTWFFTYVILCDVQENKAVAYPGILFVGGVQQIQLRTEDRENGDLGAVAP